MSLWVQMLGAVRGAAGSLERGCFCSGKPRKGNGIKGAGMKCPGFFGLRAMGAL